MAGEQNTTVILKQKTVITAAAFTYIPTAERILGCLKVSIDTKPNVLLTFVSIFRLCHDPKKLSTALR